MSVAIRRTLQIVQVLTNPKYLNFRPVKKVTWQFYETNSPKYLNGYDCVIGRDMMKTIGLDLLFSEGVMTWDDVRVPMKDFNAIKKTTKREANVLCTDLEGSISTV